MAGLTASRAWAKNFTKRHLKDIFFRKIKSKPSVGLDWVTPTQFEGELNRNIDTILRKCNMRTYKFTRYREKLVLKGARKPPRRISIPTVRDKLVLSALNELLVDVYGTSAITPMPQVVISEIAGSLNNSAMNSFIKTDIETFYASIDRSILMGQLKSKVRKAVVYELLEKAINTSTGQPGSVSSSIPAGTKEGIPEGLPISNALANLYLQGIDVKYRTLDNCLYWRYVDDILILTSDALTQKIKDGISSDMDLLSLKLSKEKTISGKITEGFEFLGYFISSDKISVRRSSVIALERTIETIFRNYANAKKPNKKYLQWKINLKITGFILNGHKYGWVFFYSQINDLTCLSHLDWLLKTLSLRFDIEDIHFKSFMRSYHEITKSLHATNYIPNLDNMSIDEKKQIIQDVYNESVEAGADDSIIDSGFKRIMTREIRDIQKDVQPFS